MNTQHIVIIVGALISASLMGVYNKPIIEAKAKPSTSAVTGLTEKDLRGTVRLGAADRQRQVATCAARVATIDMRGRGHVRIEGSIPDFAKERTSKTTRVCDCLVEQVENRANGLQFRMFMSALQISRGGPLSSMPNYREYWDFAVANGAATEDFREMTTELGQVMIRSAETCEAVLGR